MWDTKVQDAFASWRLFLEDCVWGHCEIWRCSLALTEHVSCFLGVLQGADYILDTCLSIEYLVSILKPYWYVSSCTSSACTFEMSHSIPTLMPLPGKVTGQRHQILRVSLKVTLKHRQILRLLLYSTALLHTIRLYSSLLDSSLLHTLLSALFHSHRYYSTTLPSSTELDPPLLTSAKSKVSQLNFFC